MSWPPPEMGAGMNVATTLAWARSAIRELSPATARDRLAELDEIAGRLLDPELHLAIVGEFSSGKSSLINAIVGHDLMPRSALPTTRAIAQIGNSPTPFISVCMRGREEPLIYSSSQSVATSPLFREIAALSSITAEDMSGLMWALTADAAVTPLVESIRVGLPFPPLGRDLVLYDTPGTNDEEHLTAEVERLVTERADAVAVIVRADVPVSMTLQGLISTLAERMPPECFLFIVTHSDVIDSDQRAPVLRSISRRVAKVVGGDAPKLFDLSLRGAMRRNAGLALDDEEHGLVSCFDRQLDALKEELRVRRGVLAARRSLQLLATLLSSLDDELVDELDELQTREDALADAEIEDVDAYSSEIDRSYRAAVHDDETGFRRQLARIADDRVSALETTLLRGIEKAADAKTLRVVTTTNAEKIVAEHTTELERSLRLATTEHIARMRALSDASLGEFVSRYEDVVSVAALGHGLNVPEVRAANLQEIEIGDMSTAVSTLLRQATQAKNKATVAGAVVGTFLAPGVGTVIGGGIGRAVGALFGPALTQMKQVATDSTKASLATYRRGALEESLTASAAKVSRQLDTQFAAALARLASDYAAVVDIEKARQREECDSIERRRRVVLECRRELEVHVARVEVLMTGEPTARLGTDAEREGAA